MRALCVFALVGLGLLANGEAQAQPRAARVILGVAGMALSPFRPGIRLRALKPRRHVIHRGRRTQSRAAALPTAGAVAGATAVATPTRAGVAGATPAPDVFWPYAYDDLFSYALGQSNGERFWHYGVMEIVGSVAGPAIAESDPTPPRRKRAPTTSGSMCLSADDIGWPASWIAERARPNAAQKKLLADVSTSLNDAATYLTASCSAPTPATASADPAAQDSMNPADMVRSRIWAMRQAVIIVRRPLKEFHASLSDAQKARLAPVQRRGRKDANTVANLCSGDEEEALEMPSSADSKAKPDAPTPALDPQAMKPLRDLLKASCPRTEPKTVTERLDAMADRLVAMEYALLAIGPTLRAQQAQSQPAQQDAPNAMDRPTPGEPP